MKDMITYIYEEGFQGLLSAIYEAFYAKERPEAIVSQRDHQATLHSVPVWVMINNEKADKVYKAIADKISKHALRYIYYAFLSDSREKGIRIYDYLKLGFKEGSKVDLYVADQRVKALHDLYAKVAIEKHRMHGLVRFQLLENGIYYARIEPDHDIAELLAPHFSKRLADQHWIIHDLAREKAVLYNQREWISTILTEKDLPPLKEEEHVVQEIWKKYFRHIAIAERKNQKVQRNFMPKRYWKHLTEIDE